MSAAAPYSESGNSPPQTGTTIALDREALALRVAAVFQTVFAKLSDHKDDIESLWREFSLLEDGETISGCSTKTEFCQKILGRSIRTVQYLIAGRDSQAEKPTRTKFVSPAAPSLDPAAPTPAAASAALDNPAPTQAPTPVAPDPIIELTAGSRFRIGETVYELLPNNHIDSGVVAFCKPSVKGEKHIFHLTLVVRMPTSAPRFTVGKYKDMWVVWDDGSPSNVSDRGNTFKTEKETQKECDRLNRLYPQLGATPATVAPTPDLKKAARDAKAHAKWQAQHAAREAIRKTVVAREKKTEALRKSRNAAPAATPVDPDPIESVTEIRRRALIEAEERSVAHIQKLREDPCNRDFDLRYDFEQRASKFFHSIVMRQFEHDDLTGRRHLTSKMRQGAKIDKKDLKKLVERNLGILSGQIVSRNVIGKPQLVPAAPSPDLGGVTIIPDFLTPEETQTLFDACHTLEYKRKQERGGKSRHASQISFKTISDAPPAIQELQRRLTDHAGIDVNHLSVIKYDPTDFFVMHQHRKDFEKRPHEMRVWIVSMGAERPFRIQKILGWRETKKGKIPILGDRHDRVATSGSLITLPTEFNRTHFHGVPAVKDCTAVRYAINAYHDPTAVTR
jgi:hypothetical protein